MQPNEIKQKSQWDKDLAVMKAMRAYGGSFVQTLGDLAMRADSNNLARLKKAFPKYWEEYAELAATKGESE